MHSIHDMLQRFRNTMPTSREERRRQQKQGQLQEMWWICDKKLADMDDERDVDYTGDNSEGSLDTKKSAATTKAQQSRSVDRLISEDIQHLLEAESRGADYLRTCRAPRVLPSPNLPPLSGKSLEPLKKGPPLGSLVPVSGHRLAVGTNSTILEEVDDPLFVRHSIGPDPPVYTGSAGLRAGNASSSSQEKINEIRCEEQDMGVIPSTVVGIASELDVVLENLRSSMGQDEEELQITLSQEQDAPRRDLPINLGQIAHDLDAKLLEFTLMARARERAASETRTAEDAQKAAWKQGETKRIEELVSQECSILRNAAQEPRGGEKTSNLQDRMRGNLFPTEDSSDGSFVGLANNARRILSCGEGIPSSSILSATHASSSPDSTSYPSKDPDANRDLAMRQMADVIKSVEARIKQIQALHVCDASSCQEEGTTGHGEEHQGILVNVESGMSNIPPTDTSKEGNIEAKRDGEDITGKINLDVAQQAPPLPGNTGPSIAAMADADISRKMRDMGSIHGSAPNVGGSLKVVRPCQEDSRRTGRSHIPHTALPSAWLYGKTNLEQTGRCIGAELEVTMLCMQKRLEQGPINPGNFSRSPEGEENDYIRIENKGDGSPKDTLIEEGLEPDDVSQQELQMLADNMARSKESDKIDRKLGLETGNILGSLGDAGRDWDHLEYRMPLVPTVGARVHSVIPSSPYFPPWVDHNPAHGGSLFLPLDHTHLNGGATCIPSCNTHDAETLHEVPPWALATKSYAPFETTIEDAQHVWQEPSAPLPNSDVKYPEDFSPSQSGVLRSDGCCLPPRGLDDTAVQAASHGHCLLEGIKDGDDDIKTGFALARARRRLRDIQKARTNMWNHFHSYRGANASSTDTQGVPQPVVEAHQVLNKLRRMRSRLTAGHI